MHMKHTKPLSFLLLTLLLATWGGELCHAQTYNYNYSLINHDTLTLYNCRGKFITLNYNNPGSNETFDGCAIIDTYGAPFSISLSITYFSSDNDDTTLNTYLSVWDGDSATGTQLYHSATPQFGNVYNTQLTSSSGRMTLHLHCEGETMQSLLFTANWSTSQTAFSTPCAPNTAISNLQVTNLTDTTAFLQWESGANAFLVKYNSVHYVVSSCSANLTGLTPNTRYDVTVIPYVNRDMPCCGDSIVFYTNNRPCIGTPDFTNLEAFYMRGFHGNVGDPYENIGIIDNGPAAQSSRHTVHRDTAETDTITGGLLHTVCPGTRASVRLGNPMTGSEAEALTYYLTIDTNVYALLILHYAVVLQNPGHSLPNQPRFRMEILDNNDNIIDPICGAVDFIANSSLGWNSDDYTGTLWKDWTTLGFDMTPYHGQVVKVRFTTYDCAGGLHYGYAYFNAEVKLNSANTEYCGSADSNSITAPDGFNYLWYYTLGDTISTEQTVHFSNNDALLNCRLISKENPACYVTLNTYAGHRWPLAIAEVQSLESLECDGYRVYFLNRSVITNDNDDTVEWHCETAWWYFGDNYVSPQYAPQHVYRDSGDYTVRLIAGIAGNQCRDTTEITVHIPDFYKTALKDTFACDSMVLGDRVFFNDTLGPKYRVHHDDDCDTVYTLDLHMLHTPLHELPPDTFCYSNTYTWRGQSVTCDTITQITHYRLLSRLPHAAANGCDSLLALPLVQMPPQPLSIARNADCSQKKYMLTAVTDLPYVYWSSEPPDAGLIGHETDRQVYVVPHPNTVYTLRADHRDTFFCPTETAVSLNPVAFPEAQIKVNPEALNYDRLDFDAYDISRVFGQRKWGLLFYPSNGDTLYLAETSGHLHHTLYDASIDSLMVILAVSNGDCLDTARHTLPILKVAFWAPNAFTPAEGSNNRFAIVNLGLLEAELYIYDREGRLLFKTSDLVEGWDGSHNGVPCPQAAYVWHLRYRAVDYPDAWRSATGTVTLLR